MFERLAEKLLNQMNSNFLKHTEILTNEIFNLNNRIDKVQNENESLKKDILELSSKNSTLTATCNKLEQKLDQLEQKEIINHVSINGEFQIEPKKEKIISFINTTMPNAKLTDSNIVDFQIMKKDKTSILKIKLDSNATKTKLFQARKQAAPKNIYLSECLTQRQYQLLQEAKKVAKSGHLRFAWSRNGSVFVKQTETSKPMPVYQLSDLDKFIPK
jgi:environmental stress-induced protein Ves